VNSQRQICVTGMAETIPDAMAWALNVIDNEKVDNPSIGIIPDPSKHCPCPDHNADKVNFQVQVMGIQWTVISESVDWCRR